MIHVLELGEPDAPHAWFAYDDADLLRKVASDDPLPLWKLHDRISARELLEVMEATPATPGVADAFPDIVALGVAHGWDTPLHRADHLLEPGTYRPEPVSERDAAFAALRARGPVRVYFSDAEATAAFERTDDPVWAGAGWRARWALRDQLVALEVLADDL